MKEVLISIQPERVGKIINGEMSIIVQKTRPKIDTPFKCYIYRTTKKVTEAVEEYDSNLKILRRKKTLKAFRGEVIGEFVCDWIDDFYCDSYAHRKLSELGSCLSEQEIRDYCNGQTLYGWHISDLKIYDKPKELSEFYKPFKYDGDGIICGTEKEMNNIYEWDCETLFKDRYPDFKFENCKCKNCPKAKDFYRLTRPPKNWCYVEELEVE